MAFAPLAAALLRTVFVGMRKTRALRGPAFGMPLIVLPGHYFEELSEFESSAISATIESAFDKCVTPES